jgi:DNA-binding transcriptional LysR family regulator
MALGIAMPDLLAALAPRLVSALVGRAPGMEVRLSNIGPALGVNLAAEPPNLALVPARFVEDDVRVRSLGDLRFAVVGRRRHPALRRPLTAKSWLAESHVVVRVGNERTNLIDEELSRRGLARRVGLEVPSFLAGLLVVARSELLMNVPVPLANDAAKALGLQVRDAPIPLPSVRFTLAWHSRFHHDPAHRWARDQVFEAVRPAFEHSR